jgi:hypothetical protein
MLLSLQHSELFSTKGALGALSVLIMVVAYAIYLRQTFHRQVLPHPLSWFLFGSTTLVTYCVQAAKGAGPGSWVTGLTAVSCFVIFAYSWYRGRVLAHSPGDWVFFWGAFGVLGCYIASILLDVDSTFSAAVAAAADLIAYAPSVRKGWNKPNDDSVTSYLLNSAKFIPSLFALGSYSVATCLLPAALVLANAAFAGMLLWRRVRLAGTRHRATLPTAR